MDRPAYAVALSYGQTPPKVQLNLLSPVALPYLETCHFWPLDVDQTKLYLLSTPVPGQRHCGAISSITHSNGRSMA